MDLLDTAAATVASIPAPPTNKIGPLRAYGLMIALGVLAAVELSRVRWQRKGGDADDIYAIAFWCVPAGLVGARLWHVITDNQLFRDDPMKVFAVQEGGLGIPGGIILGLAAGCWVAHRRGIDLHAAFDAILPTVPLAQAIGRLGNWWNQELFGGPSDLPWALEVDPEHRPPQYATDETFHPTFAYEAVWNLGLCLLLIQLDRRKLLRPGNVLPLYLVGYGIGRLWVEGLRTDPANHILGLRVNTWTSIGLVLAGAVWLAVRGARRRPDDRDEPYRPGLGPAAEDRVDAASTDGDGGSTDDGRADDEVAGEADGPQRSGGSVT
jgi:prolipoprotein diacylglyceryl transferase